MRQRVFTGAVTTALLLAPVGIATAATVTGDPVVIAVGDMACDPMDPYWNTGLGTPTHCQQLSVSDAALRDSILTDTGTADRVAGLGDYQYKCADPAAYDASYTPTWGRLDSIMYPVAGNHDYLTGTNCLATSYYSHFTHSNFETHGEYTYTVGSWLFIALNAQCTQDSVGGCTATSTQTAWLKSVLQQNADPLNLDAKPCVAAYWHQPLYGRGATPATTYTPWWQLLYDYHADVVLNGHVHNYQRYLPMNPYSNAPDLAGPTEYVVGTGGESLVGVTKLTNPPVAAKAKKFGYLRMTLGAAGWTAEFVEAATGTAIDTSTGTCHSKIFP